MNIWQKQRLFVALFLLIIISSGFAKTIMMQINLGVEQFLLEDSVSWNRTQKIVENYEEGLFDSLFERGYILFNAPGFIAHDGSDLLLMKGLNGAQEKMFESMRVAQDGGAQMLIYADLIFYYDQEIQIPILKKVDYRIFDVQTEIVMDSGTYSYDLSDWQDSFNSFEAGHYFVSQVLDAKGNLFAQLPGGSW